MAKRLGLGMHWDAGASTSEQRRERIRAAVLAYGLGLMLARKRNGAVLTAGMAFATTYGVAP